MKISYQLSLSDYMKAQHLYYWRKFSTRLSLILNYAVFPVLGAVGIGVYFYQTTVHPQQHWSPGFFVSVLVLMTLPFLFRFNLRRSYTRSRITDGNCNLDLNEENIQTDIPGYAKSTVEWQAVRQYQEDKKTVLIYIARARFFVIPKRVLAPGQYEELIALLHRKVQIKKI